MMKFTSLFCGLLLLSPASRLKAEGSVPGPIAVKGELLFVDDFERSDLGVWKVIIPGFKVEDGVLIGTQDRDDHGAVGRAYLPMKDVIVSFRFKLEGSPGFNLVFDDKNHKASHAGHICRVALVKNQIRLGDDKEGIMRNDIFEMRRDPETKAKAEAMLKGRSAAAKSTIKPGKWHTMTVEIIDDEMRASLDGVPVIHLKSPGIAHPTKESLHFTVNGPGVHFDDVKVWKAGKVRK
ncbi:MAG: DUF1080 domain-containing protein [Verrucomicrobiales bacterium]|nr:DUF1080 domain-containing protein [Verrucomicrobiales bacterium]